MEIYCMADDFCKEFTLLTNITDTRYCDLGGIRLPGAWVTGGVVLTIGR